MRQLLQRERVFREKTLELWDKFAVQGVFRNDKVSVFSDLDGKSALFLLRLSGILSNKNHRIETRVVEKKPDRSEISQRSTYGEGSKRKILSYVAAGETLPGAIHIDTGEREGIISDEDSSAFFDHHGPESGLDSSATKKVYEGLVSLNILRANPILDKMVNFVTTIDNYTSPNEAKYFMDSYRTIFGLQRFITPENLYNFFKDGHNSTDLLTDAELTKYGLEKRSKEQKEITERAKGEFQQLSQDGFVIPTKTGGKALIGLNKAFSGSHIGAEYFGAKVYIIWNPEKKNFFISNNEKDLSINLTQGKNIRGKMWIKPRNDNEPLKISLNEVIRQITDPNFIPTGKLAEYLNKG